MYSNITTGAVHGIDSYLIQVETDISDGLPSFNMVGFMSGEVREASICRPAGLPSTCPRPAFPSGAS